LDPSSNEAGVLKIFSAGKRPLLSTPGGDRHCMRNVVPEESSMKPIEPPITPNSSLEAIVNLKECLLFLSGGR
jgi:hypothetical protein